ncbi:hypothetical protein ABTZ99_07000 [Actinosynnema sp. NPDC002837]
MRDDRLKGEILAASAGNRGSRRTEDPDRIARRGMTVARCAVERLMRAPDITGVVRARTRGTTVLGEGRVRCQ